MYSDKNAHVLLRLYPRFFLIPQAGLMQFDSIIEVFTMYIYLVISKLAHWRQTLYLDNFNIFIILRNSLIK